MIVKRILGKLWAGWKRFAHIVGVVNRYVFLTVFYFVCVCLVNLGLRVAGSTCSTAGRCRPGRTGARRIGASASTTTSSERHHEPTVRSDAMNILGISAFYHDSAACLLQDGRIVAAASEERFTRKKHDHGFPINAIRYCLREGGITATDLDHVGFYDKPLLKFERILVSYLATFPRSFV